MKNVVYLVETQVSEWDFFPENLADFSLRCASELRDIEADAKAVSVFIHSRVGADFLAAHPGVKLITTRSTGYDQIDVAECTRLGVTVCNVSSVDENTVAEHTFALMLAVARRLQEVREANKQPHFQYETLRAWDLRGKTLGVIGTGRVGLRVIHIGLAFGMKVLAYDPYSRSLMAELLGVHYVDLGDLLGSANVITLHAPLTPETHHLLDREAFARCQEGVIVINTARGGLIHTGALIEGSSWARASTFSKRRASCKTRGSSRGPTSCSRRMSRLINSVEAVERINKVTVANIRAFFAGKPINVVSPVEGGEGVHAFEDSRELTDVSCGA